MITKYGSTQYIGLGTETSIIDVCVNYEVEMKRHNKQVNYTKDNSYFPRKKEMP